MSHKFNVASLVAWHNITLECYPILHGNIYSSYGYYSLEKNECHIFYNKCLNCYEIIFKPEDKEHIMTLARMGGKEAVLHFISTRMETDVT